jgi:hypothetical protein
MTSYYFTADRATQHRADLLALAEQSRVRRRAKTARSGAPRSRRRHAEQSSTRPWRAALLLKLT